MCRYQHVELMIKQESCTRTEKTEIKGNLIIHRVPLMREEKGILICALRYLLMNIIFIWKEIITRADVIFVQSISQIQGAMATIIKK